MTITGIAVRTIDVMRMTGSARADVVRRPVNSVNWSTAAESGIDVSWGLSCRSPPLLETSGYAETGHISIRESPLTYVRAVGHCGLSGIMNDTAVSGR